jgi:hypothetical protein
MNAPDFLPYKLDLPARRVLWLRLSAAQREDAAFLDERALPANAEGGWAPLASLLGLPDDAQKPAAAIFHIGHCGSTLLSRVLDSWPEVQGLREPLPLRTLAEAWPIRAQPQSRLSLDDTEQLLRALWTRWSQALPPRTCSVVKATSSCNGLVAPLLSLTAAKVVLLDMPLRTYLATLLKSPSSVLDAANAAGERLHDLHARGLGDGHALHALSLPEQCAMGWLAEQLRFDALMRGEHGERVKRVDFEQLLARPEAVLREVAAHFALDPAGIAHALRSPAWQRYSKAQTHDYGRDDRAHDLALAAARHGEEIAAGVAWVERFMQRHAELRPLLERAS